MKTTATCCGQTQPINKRRIDYFLCGSAFIILVLVVQHLWLPASIAFSSHYQKLAASVFELISIMWWGIAIGIITVALLAKIPREFIMATLGNSRGLSSIVRAAVAGFLLDLCSHGILMVGAKLYERGASIGQVMAFLIASPWNSFSLTIILISLIGLPWALAFIALSMVIAVITGLAFDILVDRKRLPANPNAISLSAQFNFFSAAKKQLAEVTISKKTIVDLVITGIKESRMVLRWIFFGILLASAFRTFMSPEQFSDYFGPTLFGLALTLIAATIIEVCSEGSTPIAADLLVRAKAPGNSFAFLMTGVATDYTEVMIIKETTRSWHIALLLPLLTIPQVILVAGLLNYFAT